jgi:hypothetical protein
MPCGVFIPIVKLLLTQWFWLQFFFPFTWSGIGLTACMTSPHRMLILHKQLTPRHPCLSHALICISDGSCKIDVCSLCMSADRYPVHQSDKWKRCFFMVRIDFSLKMTWILFIISREFITECFTIFYWVLKDKLPKSCHYVRLLGRTRFTQTSIPKIISVYGCFLVEVWSY